MLLLVSYSEWWIFSTIKMCIGCVLNKFILTYLKIMYADNLVTLLCLFLIYVLIV